MSEISIEQKIDSLKRERDILRLRLKHIFNDSEWFYETLEYLESRYVCRTVRELYKCMKDLDDLGYVNSNRWEVKNIEDKNQPNYKLGGIKMTITYSITSTLEQPVCDHDWLEIARTQTTGCDIVKLECQKCGWFKLEYFPLVLPIQSSTTLPGVTNE